MRRAGSEAVRHVDREQLLVQRGERRSNGDPQREQPTDKGIRPPSRSNDWQDLTQSDPASAVDQSQNAQSGGQR